jgi:16S rRNA A1518/A1519 N6-dimethyltransferase RsmA/KsgA/DIM1 with predicted DNA glycosylase/AP lyase activity
MVSPRREPRSQHFLWDRRLVDRLVRASSISPHDLVLEIGPGRGILTQALLQVAAPVVAVELDQKLYRSLHQTLGHCPTLDLVCGNFLDLPLPCQPYKVFANIPFHITGDIIRKLLECDAPPEDCYLLVQREAAGKYLPGDQHNSAFRSFVQRSNPHQRRVIHGAFTRLQEQQRQLQKIHRTRADPNWRRFGSK